ncbi:hypothetical protein [Streptomyces sp. NPDC059278]|uniref:hypothetical protein n=1 Tax=Streptomyces sp. NPDC059278 TaxID=3346801 RepID=UPI0036BB1B1C
MVTRFSHEPRWACGPGLSGVSIRELNLGEAERMLWSLLNKPWLAPVVQLVQLFAEPSRDEVYERCVEAALDDPSRVRKLDKRPGTSRRDVIREMHASMYRTAAYTQADGTEKTAYDKALVIWLRVDRAPRELLSVPIRRFG